jgi:hypothetical protein
MLGPPKYYRGLNPQTKRRRASEITARKKENPNRAQTYRAFRTDKGVKTRTSSYTARWKKAHPGAVGVAGVARVTGIPRDLVQESYDRGMAAWRTGHRPGATQEQWGYARIYSLGLCGKTARTADADLRRKATQRSSRARTWFAKQC